MPKDNLKAAVVGLGIGVTHINHFNKHDHCEVIAVCDFNSDALNQITNKFPEIKCYSNILQMLDMEEFDILSIASYDDYHYEHIKLGIKFNKHLFIEKPLCQNIEEAKKIKELIKQNKHLKYSSNHILRLSSRFQKIRSKVKNGDFGHIYHVEADYLYGRVNKIINGWRSKIDYYSVVQGGGIHMIDLLMWLLDSDIIEVASMGNNIVTRDSRFKYLDNIVSILRFKNGVTAKLSANFGCMRPHFHGLNVYGVNGTFINTPDSGLIYNSRKNDSKPTVIDDEYNDYRKSDIFDTFINSILGKGEPLVKIEEVFKALGVCFAIEQSTVLREYVDVKSI